MGWTEQERVVLEHFFTNADRPIFALRNMHPAIQNYIYAGISRFPNVRERFIRILAEKGALEAAASAAKAGSAFEAAAGEVIRFAMERNRTMYFEMRHGSSAEGASVFVVSENNPIYATEEQQDFYWPMTTMELSTRYATKFDIGRVHWEPVLARSEFAEELRENTKRSFSLYARGFEPMMKAAGRLVRSSELSTKISALDAIRFCIPLAAYTTLILGGNVRAMIEHFRKMLASSDTFVKEYARAALGELSKVSPGFFESLQLDPHLIERNRRIKEYAEQLFHGKFEPAAGEVQLFYSLPPEETALAQILYPYCTVPFEMVYDTVSGLGENERRELFGLATSGRQNRSSPLRGFETRHLVYEINTAWALWKDFKRNRMNLRFHQDTRGRAGWVTPDLIAESELAKEYEEVQRSTSELVEKIYVKLGRVSRAAATQGSKKRFLLCMGPRQLTVLGELRTCGEGDRGYRRIASRMIELAKEQNPRLFGHIVDNYKARA